MNSKMTKICGVPQCSNTSRRTPNKLFVYVPHDKIIRDAWCRLAQRDLTSVNNKTHIFFCEDHFDIPNDMQNYKEYRYKGMVSQVILKPGCMPSKFDCQNNMPLFNNDKPATTAVKIEFEDSPISEFIETWNSENIVSECSDPNDLFSKNDQPSKVIEIPDDDEFKPSSNEIHPTSDINNQTATTQNVEEPFLIVLPKKTVIGPKKKLVEIPAPKNIEQLRKQNKLFKIKLAKVDMSIMNKKIPGKKVTSNTKKEKRKYEQMLKEKIKIITKQLKAEKASHEKKKSECLNAPRKSHLKVYPPKNNKELEQNKLSKIDLAKVDVKSENQEFNDKRQDFDAPRAKKRKIDPKTKNKVKGSTSTPLIVREKPGSTRHASERSPLKVEGVQQKNNHFNDEEINHDIANIKSNPKINSKEEANNVPKDKEKDKPPKSDYVKDKPNSSRKLKAFSSKNLEQQKQNKLSKQYCAKVDLKTKNNEISINKKKINTPEKEKRKIKPQTENKVKAKISTPLKAEEINAQDNLGSDIIQVIIDEELWIEGEVIDLSDDVIVETPKQAINVKEQPKSILLKNTVNDPKKILKRVSSPKNNKELKKQNQVFETGPVIVSVKSENQEIINNRENLDAPEAKERKIVPIIQHVEKMNAQDNFNLDTVDLTDEKNCHNNEKIKFEKTNDTLDKEGNEPPKFKNVKQKPENTLIVPQKILKTKPLPKNIEELQKQNQALEIIPIIDNVKSENQENNIKTENLDAPGANKRKNVPIIKDAEKIKAQDLKTNNEKIKCEKTNDSSDKERNEPAKSKNDKKKPENTNISQNILKTNPLPKNIEKLQNQNQLSNTDIIKVNETRNNKEINVNTKDFEESEKLKLKIDPIVREELEENLVEDISSDMSTAEDQKNLVLHNKDFLKDKLKSILHSHRFCAVCFESNNSLKSLDEELIIISDNWTQTILLKHVYTYVFKQTETSASGYICTECTTQLQQAYIFIKYSQLTKQLLESYINDSQSKSIETLDYFKLNENVEDTNTAIVLESNDVNKLLQKDEKNKPNDTKTETEKEENKESPKKYQNKRTEKSTKIKEIKYISLRNLTRCELCSKIKLQHEINLHYAETHSKLKCKFCFKFVEELEIEQHLVNEHKDDSFFCDVCEYPFYTLQRKKLHAIYMEHNKETPESKLNDSRPRVLRVTENNDIRTCSECKTYSCVHNKYLDSFQEQSLNHLYVKAKCADCYFVCRTETKLIEHVNLVHLKTTP